MYKKETRMTNEINFIREIEKHECLYNYNLPEYNRRDFSEHAWAKVAKARNLTVDGCKEKWRNIRSSLLRSMKKTEKAKKKPYYLKPYLEFILPYTNFRKKRQFSDELRDETLTSQDNEDQVQMGTIKLEPMLDEQNPFENVEIFETAMLNDNGSPSRPSSPEDPSSLEHHRLKRNALKRKNSELTTNSQPEMSARLNNSSMRYFLLSLLPDFETMTEEQVRIFKIKVMMLIDDIKSNSSEPKVDSRLTNDTKRLQKRLINLLLRNLKKR